MNIAIIPARSGSKRIKNKNIKFFFGKPLIFYSIRTAIKSKLFKKVIVSTDSQKIKLIAEKYGATVQGLRPKRLSSDSTSTIAVIKYECKKIRKKNKKNINICCIYPTAPMIEIKKLKESLRALKRGKCDYVMPVIKTEKNVLRSFIETGKNKVKFLNPRYRYTRSQSLKKSFYDAGQFYWATYNTWLSGKLFLNNCKIIVLKKKSSTRSRYN